MNEILYLSLAEEGIEYARRDGSQSAKTTLGAQMKRFKKTVAEEEKELESLWKKLSTPVLTCVLQLKTRQAFLQHVYGISSFTLFYLRVPSITLSLSSHIRLQFFLKKWLPALCISYCFQASPKPISSSSPNPRLNFLNASLTNLSSFIPSYQVTFDKSLRKSWFRT